MEERVYEDSRLLGVVTRAIVLFNQNELFLIENNLSERCICARFVRYMEKALEEHFIYGYDVDVEYNRGDGGIDSNPKMLGGKLIIVDLIVHKRGYNNGYDNLICIEMKKSSSGRDIKSDKDRLKKMVTPYMAYQYQAGFMILIDQSKRRNLYGMRIESEYYRSQPKTYLF